MENWSHYGNGQGIAPPFTGDRSVPKVTVIPHFSSVDGIQTVTIDDESSLSGMNRVAQWPGSDWFYSDYQLNEIASSLPPKGYQNRTMNGTDVCSSASNTVSYGHLNTGVKVTVMNSSGDNPSNAKDNAVKSSLEHYNLTICLQVAQKPETSDKSSDGGVKFMSMSYADVVKLPPPQPDNASEPKKEVAAESASKDMHTSGTCIGVSSHSSASVSPMSPRHLVDAMHSLSQLLLDHYSKGTCELEEQDVDSLKKLVDNVDTCMSKNIPESVRGIHQAIKKVPLEKLHGKETDPEVLLYKNLWLAAKAYLDNMEIEMEKCKSEKEEVYTLVLAYKDLWLKAEHLLDNLKIEMEECKSEKEGEHTLVLEYKKLLHEAEARFDNMKKEMEKCKSEKEEAHTLALEYKNHLVEMQDHFFEILIEMEESKSYNEKDIDEHLISELDGIDKSTTEVKDNAILDQSSEDSPEPLSRTACNTVSEEIAGVKGCHPRVQHDCTAQSSGSTGIEDLLPESLFDDCSSDWEHVSKGELSD